MHGYMIESKISAKDVEALNRTGVSTTTDIDGGAMVTLGDLNNDGTFVATLATAGVKGKTYMAYNPSEHYTMVNGKIYAGLSKDPRDYTNLKGRPMDVFELKAGTDIVTIIASNILESDLATVAKGDELIPTTGGVYTKTGAVAGDTVLKVLKVKNQIFPSANIGNENVKAFECEVQVKA